MNRLVLSADETMYFSTFERLTHVDVRDNRVSELDVSAVRTLEYLNCERNAMSSLHVNGTALKNLFAACNCEYSQLEPSWYPLRLGVATIDCIVLGRRCVCRAEYTKDTSLAITDERSQLYIHDILLTSAMYRSTNGTFTFTVNSLHLQLSRLRHIYCAARLL